jgi:tetratricopeptide (TPR) repeat protein
VQVRPLLPGAGPHKVLVTSRHTLAGLGARLVDVTILDEDAAVTLLDAALRAARPGDDRITADPTAAMRLAGACGGLPLALQIVAALLIVDPTLMTCELAAQLSEERERLDRLRYDDGNGQAGMSVAAAFELSYRRLDETQSRVFRLLPVNPGPDVSAAATSALADLPLSQVRHVLAGLAQAHLAETVPGAPSRCRMHNLVRLYATRLSDEHAEGDGREQARDRLLGYYLETASAADDHLRALPGMTVRKRFTARDDALAWLDGERASLVTAPAMAAAAGRDQAALLLPLVLATYLDRRRRFDDSLAVAAVGLSAARRLADPRSEGSALDNLGNALRQVRRFEEAIIACQGAAALFRQTGDRHREAMALINLGNALLEVRRFEEAITACQGAAALFRQTGDRYREVGALNNLGNALREIGQFDEAITACQEAAAFYRQTGERHREAMALNSLGNALQRGVPVRRGHHRLPGSRRALPPDRRPPPRGHVAEQPRRRPVWDWPVRRGHHRVPGRRRHLP